MKHKKPLISASVAALFTAVIVILSQISVYTPLGVPVTLQFVGVAMAGFVLGAKWGVASVATYIIIGLIGLPVFSGFRGGAQVLFGATGGFILGFLGLVFFCGLSKNANQKPIRIILSSIGILLCHIFGTLQYAVVTNIGVVGAFLTVSLPFLIKDFILVIVSHWLSKKIKARYF